MKTDDADMTFAPISCGDPFRPSRRSMLVSSAALVVPVSLTTPGLAWAGSENPSSVVRARVASREVLSLNDGWRFHEGDIPMPQVTGHGWTYANAKAGNAWGAASPSFDDTTWDSVVLPHDFVVDQPFDQTANLSQGYRKRGVAWYRRALRFETSDRGRHIELQFGAAATHATVWFNGTIVDRNFSGYNSFSVDLTPFVRYGDAQNSLVIHVDADAMEGWWYEGGGLYRHVWMVKRDPVHIVTDGIHADPRKSEGGGWEIPADVTVANSGERAAVVKVEVEVRAPDGAVVARGTSEVSIAPLDQAVASILLPVADPALWSVASPRLHTVVVRVLDQGAEKDRSALKVGFRTVRFDADLGFFLNEDSLKIQGVCIHQDHAGVGVAVPDAIWDFRIRRLKEMGCNAIRISHHAPAVELLDACDRLGMLVLDENRVFNPTPDYIGQLEWLVRRDRNRPSVFMWSVFNEEPMQGTEAGYQMVRRMVAVVKDLDPNRPVTAAMNDGQFAPINVSQAVDVVGFNYQQDSYDRYHEENPTRPLLSTEDTSAYQTRGAWFSDRAAHVMSSDDTEATEWGNTHRKAWRLIAERPFVAGAFVWTGFDYRGEPTPFEWPSASSLFGAMDLCGFPKAAFFQHQAQWVKDRPILSIAPHWNWAGREGQPIKVAVYSNAEAVELRLNGRLLGRQVVDPYEMNTFSVPYAPGRLEATGFAAGRKVSSAVVETTGVPTRLRLTPDRVRLDGDGRDCTTVTVEALDSRGRPVPTANLPLLFVIEGGTIIGLGNGDPTSQEPEKGLRRSLFNGLAQVIVQSRPGTRGRLTLRASHPDLSAAQVAIDVASVLAVPSVALTKPVMVVEGWRHAPIASTRPDPNVAVSDSDQNSWQWVQPGSLQPKAAADGFALYRTRFTPYAAVQQRGGIISLGRLTHPAEIWLDGTKVMDAVADQVVRLPLSAHEGQRTISVLMQITAGREFGFVDVVTSGEAGGR